MGAGAGQGERRVCVETSKWRKNFDQYFKQQKKEAEAEEKRKKSVWQRGKGLTMSALLFFRPRPRCARRYSTPSHTLGAAHSFFSRFGRIESGK